MDVISSFALVVITIICLVIIGILDEFLEPLIGRLRFFVITFVSFGLGFLSINLIL